MEEESLALVPVAERQIAFYGDTLTTFVVVVQGHTQVFVQLRPICEALGLNWSGQRQRLQRDPVLADELQFVCVTHSNSVADDGAADPPPAGEVDFVRVTPSNSRRGAPTALCLPLDFLPGWLFGISGSRVRPELQAKILRYRRECFRVLWEAFQPAILGALAATGPVDPRLTDLAGQIDTLAAQLRFLREHATALLALPGQIADLGAQLTQATTLLTTLIDGQQQLTTRQTATEQRVAVVEDRTAALTPAHKRQVHAYIDMMVRTTARRPQPLTYSNIYLHLKRHFAVGSYTEIADAVFDAVMAFLRAELDRVTDDPAPAQVPLW